MKVNSKKLQEMIKEAISSYLTELDYRQRIAAVPKTGPSDQVSIDKLMMALDGLEKSGKTTVTQPDLATLAKRSIEVAAPLGKASPAALAQQAVSPTGGAPLRKPFEAKDRNITVTQSQLKEMVAKVVKSRLQEFSTGNNPIMAKREIIALMDSTSRNFENEIITTFNLRNPDTLAPDLQRQYLEIVEAMKAKLVAAAMEAVQSLINFPTEDDGKIGIKK